MLFDDDNALDVERLLWPIAAATWLLSGGLIGGLALLAYQVFVV